MSTNPSSSTSSWLTKPAGPCCLKGTLHSGTPRGKFKPIAGVETYISRPSSANGYILLYFPDVWGMFTNGLLVMDGFADAGYTVLGLDYFRGDPVWKHRKNRHDKSNPNFDYEAWKNKHTAFANEAVPRWVEAVKREFGRAETKYACVGYCFGAPYVCDLLATDAVNAGAFAHPAFLQERHFANLKKPLFLSCSETDHTFPTEARRRAIDIMSANRSKYQLQLFSGVERGFALRGNMEDAYERYVKEESLKEIVKWFGFWLGLDMGNGGVKARL
ncbi:Alpha/Beta hydrolase protein [Aspergillus stella-maris]|uniref:Alpha/Beta hydrolase protein n=1 Tax=Aspergillus stella-maris TaxID=1810926 RepID=UPI003CCCDE0C